MRGFSGTTTNLVVSLLVNLIIFSFLVLAPSPSLSLSPRLASLSRAPLSLFLSPGLLSPSALLHRSPHISCH